MVISFLISEPTEERYNYNFIIIMAFIGHVYAQFTGSDTEEDHDAYADLGNVSSVDLISFAYQIASGMVYMQQFKASIYNAVWMIN